MDSGDPTERDRSESLTPPPPLPNELLIHANPQASSSSNKEESSTQTQSVNTPAVDDDDEVPSSQASERAEALIAATATTQNLESVFSQAIENDSVKELKAEKVEGGSQDSPVEEDKMDVDLKEDQQPEAESSTQQSVNPQATHPTPTRPQHPSQSLNAILSLPLPLPIPMPQSLPPTPPAIHAPLLSPQPNPNPIQTDPISLALALDTKQAEELARAQSTEATAAAAGGAQSSEPVQQRAIEDLEMDGDAADEFDAEFDDPWFDAACLTHVGDAGPSSSASGGPAAAAPASAPAPVPQRKMGSGGSLFTTGGGAALPPVSESAKARIGDLFKDLDEGTSSKAEQQAHNGDEAMESAGDGFGGGDSFDDFSGLDKLADLDGLDAFGGFAMGAGAGAAGMGGFGGAAVGFSTGRGTKLAAPSKAAAAKALAIFKEEVLGGGDVAVTGEASGSGRASASSSARRRDPMPSETPSKRSSEFKAPALRSAPAGSAFVTAGGNKLAEPSKAALAAVSKLFADETDADGDVDMDAASGAALDAPAAPGTPTAVTAFAMQMDRASTPPAVTAQVAKATSMFSTAGGSTLAPPSDEAKARVLKLLEEEEATPAQGSSNLATPIKAVPSNLPGPLRDSTNTPKRTVGLGFKSPVIDKSKPYSRPQSTPLRNATASSSTSFSKPGQPSTPVVIGTPVNMKRVGIGLGMTPRARSALASRPKFNSPLKKGGEAGQGPMLAQTPVKAGRVPPSLLGPAGRDRRASVPARENACFDLNTRPPRQNMQAAHLHPQYFSVNELVEFNIPDEIWAINPTNARYYQFMVDDQETGPANAQKELQCRGCLRATLQWVEEHWTMILWKLASIVKAKPDMFAEKWTYHEVIRQLLYRYEREMNLAQRSAIKRIQEQDSPSSLPMVLCISAIAIQKPMVDEEGKSQPVFPVLELTDGWYRIRANTDATLARAIEGGRLQVGYKIALAGAKLDASRDGTEVLDAINSSRLVISGNSTSVAAWDARMGFCRKPFVATLPSLTKDGGTVSLMDIRITKVFPLAYMSAIRGEHVPPWTAAEEFTKQDQWKEKYAQEKTRVTQELQSRIALLEDDVSRVASATEGMMDSIEADDNLDEDAELETYRQAPNKTSYLRSLKPQVLKQLVEALQREYTYECQQGVMEIEAELHRLCPARETRSFQVIRFVDSQTMVKEPCRTGQLQVWDAQSLGEGALAEGMRFLVSNLTPGQIHSWCGPKDIGEIYLNTKRDTSWKRIEES